MALAQTAVASVTASLYFVSVWDASNNAGPPPPLPNSGNPMYKISVKGTIDGVVYDPNDNIIWDSENSVHDGSQWTVEKWMKIDNTENVATVNGKSGAVTIGIADIPGLQSILDSLQNDIESKVSKSDHDAKVAELEAAILANTLNTTIKMWSFTI